MSSLSTTSSSLVSPPPPPPPPGDLTGDLAVKLKSKDLEGEPKVNGESPVFNLVAAASSGLDVTFVLSFASLSSFDMRKLKLAAGLKNTGLLRFRRLRWILGTVASDTVNVRLRINDVTSRARPGTGGCFKHLR
ncbi:hypothetical protein PUN28_003305 [Cardiocondyla obscurior]|uniref:Uncharacterized protein n=1 Tax=Cardiocondyla obscurior TaxID=286306 RepID=A0AAW2GNK0_9HYME